MDNTSNRWQCGVEINNATLNNAMIRMTAHPMRILKSGLIQYKIWGTLLETEQTAVITFDSIKATKNDVNDYIKIILTKGLTYARKHHKNENNEYIA